MLDTTVNVFFIESSFVEAERIFGSIIFSKCDDDKKDKDDGAHFLWHDQCTTITNLDDVHGHYNLLYLVTSGLAYASLLFTSNSNLRTRPTPRAACFDIGVFGGWAISRVENVSNNHSFVLNTPIPSAQTLVE